MSAQSSTIDRVLRLPEVCHLLGLSRSTVYAQLKVGVFPRPFPLGARSVGWLSSEIGALLAARARCASEKEVRALVDGLERERREVR